MKTASSLSAPPTYSTASTPPSAGPPDYEARVELLRLYLANRPQEAIDWHNCAGELENYTSAEIEFIVNEAARLALSQNRLIANGDLLNAAGNNPPAHTAAAIEEMRDK